MKALWVPFSIAWNFLTILPLPKSLQADLPPTHIAASLGWFPAIGFILGTLLVISDTLLATLFPSPIVNILLIVLLVTITGGLHQDGLADCLDGIAGGKNPAHRLSILRDSRIGALGSTGLILAIGLRYGGLMSLPTGSREIWLFCMPAIGRWAMVMGLWNAVYPRTDGGIAQAFLQHVSIRELILASTITGIGLVIMLTPWHMLMVALLLIGSVRCMVWGASRLFGGITGDILGAMNEIAEILFLLTATILVKESQVL